MVSVAYKKVILNFKNIYLGGGGVGMGGVKRRSDFSVSLFQSLKVMKVQFYTQFLDLP